MAVLAGWLFVSYLVANSEDRFSHDEAQLFSFFDLHFFFTNFELTQLLGRAKVGEARENHLTYHKQNLADSIVR